MVDISTTIEGFKILPRVRILWYTIVSDGSAETRQLQEKNNGRT
jgi:hypothetical protein